MTVQGELDALQASLATTYPGRYADLAHRAGTVAAAVALEQVQWETACDPYPCRVTATVVLTAAQPGGAGARDLGGHLEPAAALIRAAGWAVDEAQPADVEELPALQITAITDTTA
jgi:hypothetical protein